MISPAARRDAVIAVTTGVANLAAAIVMLGVLRPGVPAGEAELEARIAHVASNATGWRLGWLVWNLAAIALIALYVALALRWRDRAPVLCRVAVLLAAAGLAADLGAETLLMVVSPGAEPSTFALVEDIALPLTGYLGNGLYTLAGILLTIAGRSVLPRALVATAALAWAAGLALSAATLVGSETGQFAATAVLMPVFVAWTLMLARWLRTAS